MVTRGSEFAGRPRYYELMKIGGDGHDIVFSQPHQTWKAMRKLAHSSLKMYDKGLERIESVSMEMINEMLQDFLNTDGQPFDPKSTLRRATMNIIASFLVGRTYKEDTGYYERYVQVENTMLVLGGTRVQGAIMGALPFMKYVWDLLKKPVQHYEDATMRMYQMVREESRKSEEDGFYDGLASVLARAVERSEIDEDNFRYMIADVILGGSLTTTTTLYGLLNILSHNPDIQDKLQREVDHVIGERQVSLSDRERMPYHMATLQELLRYTVVIPQGVIHSATVDTTINNKPVPAGTNFMFSHFAINHDETRFPEPSRFRPERFLDEEGEFVAADHPNRRGMNTFGAGPRICLGESLAKGRLFLIIAALMQRFTVKRDETAEVVSCDIEAFVFSGVLQPPQFKACFVPR